MIRALLDTKPLDYISVAIAPPNQHLAISSLLEENREWLASRGIKQWVFPFTPE
jgi:hypothetical protein